jgi:hypothetical protein
MEGKYDPRWGRIFWVFVILVVLSLAMTFLNSYFE